jgi:hypothetical protein
MLLLVRTSNFISESVEEVEDEEMLPEQKPAVSLEATGSYR